MYSVEKCNHNHRVNHLMRQDRCHGKSFVNVDVHPSVLYRFGHCPFSEIILRIPSRFVEVMQLPRQFQKAYYRLWKLLGGSLRLDCVSGILIDRRRGSREDEQFT